LKTFKIAIISISLVFSLNAFAGLGGDEQVFIFVDEFEGLAQGSMKSVRNSDNDVEYIGCKITTDSFGLVIGQFSVCLAGDANGVAVSCQIHDPVIAEAINAMMSYSRIQFVWDVPSGICTRVSISNYSTNLPNTKLEKDPKQK